MFTLNQQTTVQRLGVMATPNGSGSFPFADSDFYRQLCLSGHKSELEVIIFSLEAIDWNERTVACFTYKAEDRTWISNIYPLPKIIYDRCFCRSSKSYEQYRKLRSLLIRMPGVYLLGNGLSGKWEVQKTLSREQDLKLYLPITRQMKSLSHVQHWLQSHKEVILKPAAGSQGCGILHVMTMPGETPKYQIQGRNRDNQLLSHQCTGMSQLLSWIKTFTSNHHYLLQERLTLVTKDQIPFDVRSLMQKNENGLWQLTGLGVRCGKPGYVTANIHGGGYAVDSESFFQKHYGPMKADELMTELIRVSYQISTVLETYHGRLVELGIDFGIDDKGKLWILEANSKPGRSIFTHLQDMKKRQLSIDNPIRYAKFMIHRYINQPSQIIQEGNQQ